MSTFNLNNIKPFYYYLTLVVLTFTVFYNTLNFEFITNWDDQENITLNDNITDFNVSKINNILSPFVQGNEYQPLTNFYYIFLVKCFGISPFAFHLFNVVLHILNVLLLFYMSKKIFKKNSVAFFLSAMFAVHPAASEVVAWVSAANYLLFIFFTVTTLIAYIKYLENKSNIALVLTYFFFIMALCSKSTAVVIPLLLIALDIYYSKLKALTLINKTPFVLLSMLFVFIAISKKSSTLTEAPIYFTLAEKPLVASYIINTLAWKSIFPFNLSLIYDYPIRIGEFLPVIFWINFVIFAALIFAIIKYRKNKEILIGTLIFTSFLWPVVHIIPYYHISFYANRYMYFANFGLFIIVYHLFFIFLQKLKHKSAVLLPITYIIAAFWLLSFSFITHTANKHYANNTSFFKRVVKENPKHILGNYLLAQSFAFEEKFEESLKFYNKAIELNPSFVKAYYNRGLSLSFLNKYEKALDDFNTVLSYDSIHKDALINRALCYANTGKYIKAIQDFNAFIKVDSLNPDAYNNRGGVLLNLNQPLHALADINKAIELSPQFAAAYYNKALYYEKTAHVNLAIENYSKAIELKNDYFQAYNSRAVLKGRFFNDLEGALRDVEKALLYNNKMLDAYSNKAYIHLLMGDTSKACAEWEYLIRNKYPNAEYMFNTNCKK